MDISVIILAAGAGRYTRTLDPRSLARVGPDGNYLLEVQNTHLQNKFGGQGEVLCVLGYRANQIVDSVSERVPNVRFLLNPDHERTGPAWSAALALDAATFGRTLIIHGDMYYSRLVLDFVGDLSKSLLLTGQMHEREVGVKTTLGRVVTLSYTEPLKWGQMVYLTEEDTQLFLRLARERQRRRFYTHEILQEMLVRGCELGTAPQPAGTSLLEVDTPEDVEKLFERKVY